MLFPCRKLRANFLRTKSRRSRHTLVSSNELRGYGASILQESDSTIPGAASWLGPPKGGKE